MRCVDHGNFVLTVCMTENQPKMDLTDHRIIKWFELDDTFTGYLVQPLCSEEEHLQLDQAATSNLAVNGSRHAVSTVSLGNLF